MALLAEFEGKYRFYKAVHSLMNDGIVRISKRCLQDFLTKIPTMNTGMEEMEMNETHNVFAEDESRRLVESAGFSVREWISFLSIGVELSRRGGELVEGELWDRMFLLVCEKA